MHISIGQSLVSAINPDMHADWARNVRLPNWDKIKYGLKYMCYPVCSLAFASIRAETDFV